MPSPFPGMDPFLERPHFWPDVHHELISGMRAQLNSRLGPKYVANIEERVYVSTDDDPGRSLMIPDLRVRESDADAATLAPGSAGVAVAEPITYTLLDEEIREARIEVFDVTDRSVVTVIEVLSPSNKLAGSAGRESYLEKRSAVLASPAHWVEIDLLRGGKPIYRRDRGKARCDYAVQVSRAERRLRTNVWPIQLWQRLPVIPIPLKTEDGDVPLDLQDVLTEAYRRGAYERNIDYTHDPDPPLKPAAATWADELLKAAGLR